MNTPLLVPQTAPMRRCAVYCRVSSDERLDQSFNSIDVQKEAVHAFIQSQACEGWIAVGADYDDGGFSGGNMDRPSRRPASLNGQRTAAYDAPGACHHPEHPGRATAQVHESAVVPAEPAADRLGGAAGGSGCVRCLTELWALDHPCRVSVAFGALAHQQQVATLDGAAEIGDCGLKTAVAAPDVGQQPLANVGRDGLPALTGGFGEAGK